MNGVSQIARQEMTRAGKSLRAANVLLDKGLLEYAVILTAEQEDRELGVYDVTFQIETERAQKRVAEAKAFVERISVFLDTLDPRRDSGAEDAT